MTIALASPSPPRSLLAGAGRGTAALSPARRATDQSFTSAATAILVDVVVRDRKGRPVTDLSADDFEVAEDGVAQKVDTFTPRIARRRHRRRRGLEAPARAIDRRSDRRRPSRRRPADTPRADERPSRSCSTICRPSRCGSRSGRRSTTSR